MFTKDKLDAVLNELKIEGEDYFYYFYVYQTPSKTDYLKYGLGAIATMDHLIVCFTNKRLIFLEMTMMGEFTGNAQGLELDVFESIKVKKGLIRTAIKLTPKDGSEDLTIKANSFTFGFSSQKTNLQALSVMYG
ncbi:PH domain-containing protein [Bacillus cereus]|uniref:PH domain-containing protein n=1 Tax=Bacillus cereus TaxID=1396 RepID=UPI003D1828E0